MEKALFYSVYPESHLCTQDKVEEGGLWMEKKSILLIAHFLFASLSIETEGIKATGNLLET